MKERLHHFFYCSAFVFYSVPPWSHISYTVQYCPHSYLLLLQYILRNHKRSLKIWNNAGGQKKDSVLVLMVEH